MRVYDIAIIGAGPAGSVAAYAASRLGLDNIIIEKSFKGRDKYCGGGVSFGALEFLIRNVSKEILETADMYADGYVAISPKGRILCVSLRDLAGILVRRNVFDKKLMEIAESSGSRLIEGTFIKSLKKENEAISLISSNGEEFKAEYVILATGMTDILSLQIGLPRFKIDQIGHCWGTESLFPTSNYFNLWYMNFGLYRPIFLIFGPIKQGYGWIFPKAGYVNIGIGTTLKESKNHSAVFNGLIAEAYRLKIFDKPYSFKVDRAWQIPFGNVPRDKTYSIEFKTLAVGDVAGFVHPVTGEGIYGAVVSGWIAANIIKDAIDRNSPERLELYEHAWKNSFGKDMFDYGKKLAKLLYSSQTILELGLRGLMEDEKAVDLLTRLLAHSEPDINRKMYEYMIKHLPALAVKSLKAREKVLYV